MNELWREMFVSIVDLVGIEIDVKFVSDSDGELKIIFVFIFRFLDKVSVFFESLDVNKLKLK